MSDDCHAENRNAAAIVSTLKRKGMHLQAEAFEIAISDLEKQKQLAKKSADEIIALRAQLKAAENERDSERSSFRAIEAESNQLREVATRYRHRAEAAERALADASSDAFEEAAKPDDIDAHEKPRYTTRRMHYEINKAEKRGRNAALEEAARIVEDAPLAHNNAEIAAAIRAKVTP